ncbi:MAG: N-formylglutamate amidohydrolase, partial [Alphaproteobacteria bacterium]
ADAYRPYHQAIEDQLGLLLDRHGCALLLDCHSMPPSRARPIVFGDRFGRSAAPWLTAAALELAEKCGFSAACNDPFAGGHILDRHGRPDKGIHALQIEVDRRLYLNRTGEPSPGFDSVAALIQILTQSLGKILLDRRPAAAAE